LNYQFFSSVKCRVLSGKNAMRIAPCALRFALCSGLSAFFWLTTLNSRLLDLCSLRFAPCALLSAPCFLPPAFYPLYPTPSLPLNTQHWSSYPLHPIPYTLSSNLLSAICALRFAHCALLFASCFLPSAICLLLSAPYPYTLSSTTFSGKIGSYNPV